jgi:hypothetical protein
LDEPIDALVYSAAAALGFASVENLLYAIRQGQEVLYLRALLSVPGHLFFSAIWAFGIARSKFSNKSSLGSLVLASFLHGLYDVMLVSFGQLGNSRLGLLLVIPLMGIMAFMMRKRIKALLQSSGTQQEGRRQKDGLLRVTLSTLPPIRRAKAQAKAVAPVQAWCRHCQAVKETTTKQCPTCQTPLAFAPTP